MSQPQALPQIPRRIGPFHVLSVLGKGAMGVVLKARQEGLDRTVAVKVLAAHIAHDATFIERFQREARVSARLNHPNVVQGIDVGRDAASGLWYFAMEFIEGTSAGALLKKQGALSEREALKIARDVASALACAEANGIVHRDVKPENILIDTQGTAKLADLGLARQRKDDASLTQSGQTVGTPYYMAPEQVEGRLEAIDIRSDLYALGATLFHFVTGRPPFEGPSPAVIMARHLSDKPPMANRIAPEVSAPCAQLIAWMLEKDQKKRPQHPSKVAAEIDELLRNPAASTRSARSIAPLTRTGRRPSDSTSRQAPVRAAGVRAGTGSRRRGPAGNLQFVAIGAGTLLLLAAYLLLGGPPKPAPMAAPPRTPGTETPAPDAKTDAKTAVTVAEAKTATKPEPAVTTKTPPPTDPPKAAPPANTVLPAEAPPAAEKLEIPADALVWTGKAGDGKWATPDNWAGGKVPVSKDSVAFTEASPSDCTIDGKARLAGFFLDRGYRGTVRLDIGADLTVEGKGLRVYGGRFDGGRGTLFALGGLEQKGGVFAAPAGEWSVGTELTLGGGAFVLNESRVVFRDRSIKVDVKDQHFKDITFNTQGDADFADAVAVDGEVLIVRLNALRGGPLNVSGNVVSEREGKFSALSGELCLVGSKDQKVVAKTSPGFVPSTRIDKPSGRVLLEGDLAVQYSWTVVRGSFEAGNSTVTLASGKNVVRAGDSAFNNLVINTQGNLNIEGPLRVRGDFTIQCANAIAGGELLVGGKVTLQMNKPTFTTPITPWKSPGKE